MRYLKFLVMFGIACLFLNSCFAPGSYPNAETYEIEATEQTVIEAIVKFKMENQEFIVPNEVGLNDGRRSEKDHWFHIYFKYPGKEEIVKTWVQSIDKKTTTFAFIGINYGLEIGNWKDVHRNYSDSENKDIIKEFEEKILRKIKKNLKKKSH